MEKRRPVSVRSVASCLALVSFLAAAVSAPSLAAGPLPEWLKIVGGDGAAGDGMGESVHYENGSLFVGAPFHDGLGGTDSGVVYVFGVPPSGAWSELDELQPFPSAAGDHFGASLSRSGDILVVGGPTAGGSPGPGGAWIFERSQTLPPFWFERTSLVPSDGVAGDLFGVAVDVSGDFAIAGAQGKDGTFTAQGAAYVFARDAGGSNAWGQVKKLSPPAPAQGQLFGCSVAVEGSTALVGTCGGQAGAGHAYVFERNEGGTDNWGLVTALVPSAPGPSEGHGAAVSLTTVGQAPFRVRRAVVGAPLVGKGPVGSGAVYVFQRSLFFAGSWTETARLTPAAADPLFGWRAVVSGGLMAVAGTLPGSTSERFGRSYLYQVAAGGWRPLGEFVPVDVDTLDHEAGIALSLDENAFVAGAPGDASDRGAAFLVNFRIFSDGFESGDTTRWSAATP